MPNTETWGIIGLGWLGGRLSGYLQENGHFVWGTRRSEFDFRRDTFPPAPCDVLFLNTPPLTDLDPQLFCDKVTATGRIIFISSTSVFGMSAAKVTEKTPPSAETDSARWLVAVENLLGERFPHRLTVIRPGGLIGGERHPAKHLSGKNDITGGNEKINLIHREDLIGIITSVPRAIPLVHAVAPFHPRKDAYYPQWCEQLGVPPAHFKDSTHGLREIHSVVVDSFYHKWACPRLDFI